MIRDFKLCSFKEVLCIVIFYKMQCSFIIPEGFLPLLTYKTSFENTTWEVKNYITISIEYFEQLHRLRLPTLH